MNDLYKCECCPKILASELSEIILEVTRIDQMNYSNKIIVNSVARLEDDVRVDYYTLKTKYYPLNERNSLNNILT